MPNLRFLWNNKYPSAAVSLSTGTAALGLPLAASQNADRSYVFRSQSSTGTVVIEVDLTTSQLVTSWAVANLRLLPSSGALQLYERGTSSSPGAANLVTTIAAADYDAITKVASKFFSVTARHWRMTFTNPGVVDSYAELGYVFLGPYLETLRNVTVPMSSQRVDPSMISSGLNGQRTVASRTPYWSGSMTFEYLTVSDAALIDAMYAAVGVASPVFLVLDTSITWAAWMSYLGGQLQRQHEENSEFYSWDLPWEEAR